jgi:mRNA interferase MazF
MCDFSNGFEPPEIVKVRPVVVLSKSHHQLVSVVPISRTEPNPIEWWHHEMDPRSFPRELGHFERRWAKCDIIMTVAFWRLDRIKGGKHPATGKRIYVSHTVLPSDLAAIRKAVAGILGINLT